MIVGVDEAGVNYAAFCIYRLLRIEALQQFAIRANFRDARTGNRHRTRTEDPAVGVNCDDLAVANENIACALVHFLCSRISVW